ncbi:hypothetical protein ACE2AJ_13395 [Aquihabitans daechungensis]|uniref:ArnT family glycosyltransferase n=1 Tax=Aquihabitans daechungensis TaxID=1052257 RepID=UPI003B9F67B2
MRVTRSEFGRWVLIATALGALIRIAWLVNRWGDPIGFEDAFFYHHQANLLADGKGFISPFPFLSSGISAPAAEHPPLFSLYLAVFSFLGATSVGWHQLATTLLGIGTVPLIAVAAKEAGGRRVGVIAGFIAAIYPHLWYQDGIVWAEASAQAAVALFVLVAFRYVRRPSVRTLGALGLTAAIAAMTRTELILLLPLGVIPLALWTEGLTRRRQLRWAATALAVGIGALVPWMAFNLARFDEPTTLSSNVGLTLASANCDSTWYGPNIGYWDFSCAKAAGTEASLGGGDPSAVDAAARAEALEYISDHRGRLPAVLAARLARVAGVWSPRELVQIDVVEDRPVRVAQSGVALWWLVLGLAVVGVAALRRARIPSWPALAPVVAMLVGVLSAFASTRYRASAEPAMVVLAAAGAVSLLDRWFARPATATDPDPAADAAEPRPHPQVPTWRILACRRRTSTKLGDVGQKLVEKGRSASGSFQVVGGAGAHTLMSHPSRPTSRKRATTATTPTWSRQSGSALISVARSSAEPPVDRPTPSSTGRASTVPSPCWTRMAPSARTSARSTSGVTAMPSACSRPASSRRLATSPAAS